MWLINSTGPDSAFESPAVLLELVSGLAQLIMQEFTQALHPGGGGRTGVGVCAYVLCESAASV